MDRYDIVFVVSYRCIDCSVGCFWLVYYFFPRTIWVIELTHVLIFCILKFCRTRALRTKRQEQRNNINFLNFLLFQDLKSQDTKSCIVPRSPDIERLKRVVKALVRTIYYGRWWQKRFYFHCKHIILDNRFAKWGHIKAKRDTSGL